MSDYTDADKEAATKFSETNTTIRFIQKLYERAPHLASWLKVDIRDATSDDYYIPVTLKDACKVITVEITQNLCELLSCTPMKEKSTCDVDEPASYYYVGDDSYDVQCQPACFNLASKKNNDKDGKRASDIEMLNYNTLQNKCRYVNTHVATNLEKTFYRSATQYERRVNDMPTGYSRIKSDNPYGAGITYRNNATYCKYYDRTLKENYECDYEGWEKVLDLVIGMNAINAAKSAIRLVTNDLVPFKLPENLPKLPTELKLVHTVDGWKANINKDFVVPKLIDTIPKLSHIEKFEYPDINCHETLKKYHHNVTTAKNLINRQRAEVQSHQIYKNSNKNVTHHKQPNNKTDDSNNTTNYNNDDDSEQTTTTTTTDDIKPNNAIRPTIDINEWTETMKKILISLLRMVTERQFYEQIVADRIIVVLMRNLQNFSKKVIERMTLVMGESIFKLIGSLGEKVIFTGMRGVVAQVVSQMALRVAAQSAIIAAKLLAASASVIGWILAGVFVIDLIFAIWDPFGYNNIHPASYPNDFINAGELAMRQAYNMPSLNFEFANLIRLVLTEDEITEIQLEGFLDTLIYLDALVVNSDGMFIDKGPQFNTQNGTLKDYTIACNQANTERIKFNVETYHDYNEKFMHRVELTKYLNYTGAFMLLTSGALFLIKLNVICMIFLILGIIVLALSRLNLNNDILVEVYYKYQNKLNPNGEQGYSPV